MYANYSPIYNGAYSYSPAMLTGGYTTQAQYNMPQGSSYFGNTWRYPAPSFSPATGYPAAQSLQAEPVDAYQPSVAKHLSQNSEEPVVSEKKAPAKPHHVLPLQLVRQGQSISYSQALHLIDNKQVKFVTIEKDPKSLTALPTAKLILENNKWVRATLPNQLKYFAEALEKQDILYSYSAYQPSTSEKASSLISETFKETMVPLLIFGLTMGLGWLGFRHVFRPMMEKGPIEDALRRSIKTFDEVQTTPDQVLQYYEPKVQELVNDFRRGHKNYLIAQGPPGTGKTFLLKSIARERIKSGNAVALDPGFDGRVRNLLYRIYGGDEVESKHAIQSLQKMHGKPFDEIILLVNEMEHLPELNQIIVKAVDNEAKKAGFPTLRLLATSNKLPAFDGAVKSRVTEGIMFIDHAPPETLTEIILEQFQKRIPGFQADSARQTLTEILATNEGYSTRSLSKVVDAVIDEVNSAHKTHKNLDPLTTFQLKLFDRPLDDGEIAGLIRKVINDRLRRDQRVWLSPTAKGIDRLNRQVMTKVETFTDDLGVELAMNGKEVKSILEDELSGLVKEMGGISTETNDYLKITQRLANALRSTTLLEADKDEVELAQKFARNFADFIENTIPPSSFKNPLTHHTVVRLLRSPEPLPELREELMEVAEYYADNVKLTTPEELKAIFAAAADPVQGKLHALSDDHRNIAESMRKVLKIAIKADH